MLDPGDKIVDCPPTFTMYEFDAAVNGALVIKGSYPPIYHFIFSFLPFKEQSLSLSSRHIYLLMVCHLNLLIYIQLLQYMLPMVFCSSEEARLFLECGSHQRNC